MLEFNPNDYINKDMNCYKDYTPDKVMKKFKEVFIDSTTGIAGETSDTISNSGITGNVDHSSYISQIHF
jgi:hypothetical protein